MRTATFPDGIAICAEFPDRVLLAKIAETAGLLPLIIADPPYGNIVADGWDKAGEDDSVFATWMLDWTRDLAGLMHPGGALYVFGGVGKPGFRPYFRYAAAVEKVAAPFELTPITWAKRRGYGIQWSYLFAREEIALLILGDQKKPRCFNIPLLDTLRGYAGYSAAYPAKSEYLRRTTVWRDVVDMETWGEIVAVFQAAGREDLLEDAFERSVVWHDVTEILRGKVHVAQKPRRLMDIMIEAHTAPGEWVLDPFAGSGTTGHAARALARKFILVERDPEQFDKMVAGLEEKTAWGNSA